MRNYYLFISLFIGLLSFLLTNGSLDFIFESRRVYHVAVSFLLTGTCFYFLNKNSLLFLISFGLVFILGVFKEYTDPIFDPLDIVANSIGMGLFLLFIATNFYTTYKTRIKNRYL